MMGEGNANITGVNNWTFIQSRRKQGLTLMLLLLLSNPPEHGGEHVHQGVTEVSQ